MGVSTYYQAMPEQSTLFKRLQTEKTISTLFHTLFPYSYGIFHILYVDKGEFDEILDDLAECNESFNSRVEVEQCLNELCEELKQASTLYSGLEWRCAYLEKSQAIIGEQLSREIIKRRLGNYLNCVEKLLSGDQNLAPDLFDETDEQTLLVPPSVVQSGTQILREIGADIVFEVAGELDPHYLEEFQCWRAFYLEAAERGEAVVVRFS